MGNALSFIRHIDRVCKKNGFELELVNSRYIDIGDGFPCAGYFSEDEKKICASLKAKDFLGILAHEFGHFNQYIDSLDFYEFCSISYVKVFDWLSGKKIRNIDFHLDNCLQLELDCEKRAVSYIQKYELEIDIEDYIQRANAYMYFWRYLRYSKKWCNPYNAPSNNEALVRIMPKKFLKEYVLSDKIKDVFEKENI